MHRCGGHCLDEVTGYTHQDGRDVECGIITRGRTLRLHGGRRAVGDRPLLGVPSTNLQGQSNQYSPHGGAAIQRSVM